MFRRPWTFWTNQYLGACKCLLANQALGRSFEALHPYVGLTTLDER